MPALGGNFPPALDRMLERALAKRPEDRWGSALELADALRSASGVGAGEPDLPRIDEGVRDAWLSEAPQPLAESIAAIDGRATRTRCATRPRSSCAICSATFWWWRSRRDRGQVTTTRRCSSWCDAMSKRDLSARERLELLRLLVRPHRNHPIPELLELVTPGPDGTDVLETILTFYSITECSGSEDSVRRRMRLLFPVLGQLLHKMTFLLDHVLVVPRGGAAERWTGQPQERRMPATVMGGELVDGHPMLLDRNGRICADLWPLIQAIPPSDDADPALFVFDGRSRHGAELIAARQGIVRDDSAAWTWIATNLIAKVETKARMRDQIQTAARQWDGRGRSDSLLWRGDVLADYEHWTRHTAAPPLADPEAAFIAASLGHARRGAWIRRVLVAAAAAGALAWIMDHEITKWRQTAQTAQQETRIAQLQTSAAEQVVTQAHVEQGRAAVLLGDSSEAQLHLTEAYRRGDRSPGVEFMLARAMQPRLAQLAHFASCEGRMWSAGFSPNGQRIVTTDDACAQVWDAASHRLLFTLPHGDTVYHAVYSADGTRLITASGDGFVRIWNAANGSLVRKLKNDGKPLRYFVVASSPDGRLVAAIDVAGEVVRVWDAAINAPVAEMRNSASGFPSLAFSADGHWLATSGGEDVRVFGTSTWTKVASIAGPGIHSLSFDPTGPRLATGSSSGDASIWEIPSGVRTRHLREIGEPIESVAFSPDGKLVANAGRNGAEIWTSSLGALQSRFNSLHGTILSIEFDPTSKLVVAAADNGSVIVADAAQGMPITVLEGPRGLVQVAHFDPSSRRVVGASWDGTAYVWDATSAYRRWSSPAIADDCGHLASLEPDQRFIAVDCLGRGTRVWDTSRDLLLAKLPSVTPVAGDFESAFPAVSAAGDRAAIARGATVEVYELPSARLLRVIRHSATVNAVAFAPAGHDLVSGAIDGSLLVTHDERESIALPVAAGGIDAAALLADGRVMAVDARGRLRIYDPDRGTLLAELAAPTRVRMLRPSLDGHRLITIPSYSGKMASPVLWDLERYRPIAQLEGHAGRVFSARFVDAGRGIVTAGNDGSARLWDGETGRLRQTFHSTSRFLADATLDGSMIIAGGTDGLLWFWDAASGRPLWTLQAHKSHVVGVHLEGEDVVTRGFSGDVSRWALPSLGPCGVRQEAIAGLEACVIVPK